MARVDDQHRVELEADRRPRLDVAHARQQERGQHFAIRVAAMNAVGDLFEQPLARRFLDQPHERFDGVVELHQPGRQGRLLGRDARQAAQESEPAGHRGDARARSMQKRPTSGPRSVRGHR